MTRLILDLENKYDPHSLPSVSHKDDPTASLDFSARKDHEHKETLEGKTKPIKSNFPRDKLANITDE